RLEIVARETPKRRAASGLTDLSAPEEWPDGFPLLICAGKHPKYIAQQAGHSSAGFCLDRYGTLFETVPISPVEWWDDLLWPSGHHMGTIVDTSTQNMAGEQGFERTSQAAISSGCQE
ncbi:MAG TPA: hypothetical protein VJX71_23155, partial [Methylomirabilota bacterium]|nr:hypothetical protein [Methylomirabilota bacterium]